MGLMRRRRQYEDLTKAGVIDPTKVVRSRIAERGQRGVAVDHDGSDDRGEAEEGNTMPPMPPGGMGTCTKSRNA